MSGLRDVGSSRTHLLTTHSLQSKKGGGRPFLDQVADCRSARSSAPRCMRTSAPSGARPNSNHANHLNQIAEINLRAAPHEINTLRRTRTAQPLLERRSCRSFGAARAIAAAIATSSTACLAIPLSPSTSSVLRDPTAQNDSAYCAQSPRVVNMVDECFFPHVTASTNFGVDIAVKLYFQHPR